MNFLADLTADEIEEIQQALTTLSHHRFFKRMTDYRTTYMLNATYNATDQGLPPLIRTYQAEVKLLGELSRMAEDAAQTINALYGDSNASDAG